MKTFIGQILFFLPFQNNEILLTWFIPPEFDLNYSRSLIYTNLDGITDFNLRQILSNYSVFFFYFSFPPLGIISNFFFQHKLKRKKEIFHWIGQSSFASGGLVLKWAQKNFNDISDGIGTNFMFRGMFSVQIPWGWVLFGFCGDNTLHFLNKLIFCYLYSLSIQIHLFLSLELFFSFEWVLYYFL